MTLASGAQVGKYLLGKKLGQGGFGVVFRATDASLDREVALKFLTEEASREPQVLQRFLQEARSAAKIAHPGIVTVFECGQLVEANNTAYIAMELLDGESLTDRLARSGRLPFEGAVEIARQIASALEAAHRAGIVHRDLKPDNVFLVRDPAIPGGERVKILDFGIAKLGRQSSSTVQTQSMQVFGTPRYMSPEQCKSAAAVDHRSDIYTLGCILFELVTGQPPFKGGTGELIAQHVLVEAPRARTIVPELPEDVDLLIAALLAKEPDDRPATMAAVQRQLESAGAISPGVAPTLLPNAIPQPPRLGAPYAYGRAGSRSGSTSPTTLGAAASSAVVSRAPRNRRVVIGAIGAAVVVAAAITIAIRLSSSTADTTNQPVAVANPLDAPPQPPPAETPHPAAAKPAPEPVPPEAPEEAPRPSAIARARPATSKPRVRTVAKAAPKVASPEVKPSGTLTVTAKPMCEVRIEGFGTFHTPIQGFKLPVGKHVVTIVNPTLGVDDRFVVEIEAGGHETVVKDYTAPAPEGKDKDRTIDPMKPRDKGKGKGKDKTINPFAKPGT